jgi:hypothetical protein
VPGRWTPSTSRRRCTTRGRAGRRTVSRSHTRSSQYTASLPRGMPRSSTSHTMAALRGHGSSQAAWLPWAGGAATGRRSMPTSREVATGARHHSRRSTTRSSKATHISSSTGRQHSSSSSQGTRGTVAPQATHSSSSSSNQATGSQGAETTRRQGDAASETVNSSVVYSRAMRCNCVPASNCRCMAMQCYTSTGLLPPGNRSAPAAFGFALSCLQ